jgi:hypothetical protein
MVQDLRVGDLVKTLMHGYKPIHTIGVSWVYNDGTPARVKDKLYTLPKSKYPELIEDLVITGGHSILVDTLTDEQKVGTIKYFGACKKIDDKFQLLSVVNERATPYPHTGTFKVYHFALEGNKHVSYGVYANGLLVESCSQDYLKNVSGMTLVRNIVPKRGVSGALKGVSPHKPTHTRRS